MFKNIKKRFTKEAASAVVYTISSLFTKGLGMISVPIFTRLMTTAEIGTVNLFNSWTSLISVVATLSLTSGGYMVALKEFEKERNQYQSSVLTLTTLVGALLLAVYFISPEFWCNLLGMDQSLMILMLVGFLITPATEFWLARQRYEYKYKLSAVVSMGSALFATLFAVAAVVILSDKNSQWIAQGRLYAHHAVTYSVALVLWIFIIFRGRKFVSVKYWRFSLGLSIPLIANSFAGQILSQSDRVMIGRFVGNSAVGIYSTLYTVSTLSQLVWGAINNSFIPYLYKNIDQEDGKRSIKKISTLLLACYGMVCILLTFMAPEIIRILATEEYYEAVYIMPPIAAGIFFMAISNMQSNVLLYHKKSHYIMLATIVGAVLNVVLNAMLIPRFGYAAAAYTTLVGYIVMAAMQTIISNHVHTSITGRKETVYNDYMLLIISIMVVAICMLGLLLYKTIILRYIAAIILFVAIVVCYRKQSKKM